MIDSHRARVRVQTLKSMLKTGVQNPEKIPPWVRDRLTLPFRGAWCSLATAYRTHDLPNQRHRLDALRDGSETYALVVLDACRYDYFHDVFQDDIHGDITPVASAGRDTFEYLQTCWPDEYTIPYVSAAVPVNDGRIDFDETGVHHLYNGYQPRDHLRHITPVWKTDWDRSLGACPPEPVTKHALNFLHHDSVVAHYQQPHTPYIGEERELGYHDSEAAYPGQVAPIDEPIWTRVKTGEISDERLHELYRSNLERARPSVLALIQHALEEFDTVVVTADHGEALGEYGVYAHPRTPHHPRVREVAWVKVAGLTRRGRQAASDCQLDTTTSDPETDGFDVEERLAALGYRTGGGTA